MTKNNRKLKLFNFFNRRNSIKKQQILLTGIVVANFIFGILRPNDIKKSNHLNEKTLVQEKIISDKEFIGLDNSGTKSKIIKTGSGNILEFKEELSTTNSNAINKITLVKNSGILPGSDAYTPTVVHKWKPRMRGARGIHVDGPVNPQFISFPKDLFSSY